MKTLYIECNMGVAGDMLQGALLELTGNKNDYIERMNSLGIPWVTIAAEDEEKCGIHGTHIHVKVNGEEEGESCHHHKHSDGCDQGHHHHHEHDHEHHHHHSSLKDIYEIIDGLRVSEKVKIDSKAIYKIIAEAECQVHQQDMEHIHFHEVGTFDAIADIVGNCILMEEIGAEHVVCSPVHVGRGHVHCAHGILPVPAPATALILEGMPIYSAGVNGELCTPTGAAILKHFVDDFGDMPFMTVSKTGYGMGTKSFDQANCVRAMIGDENVGCSNEVIELTANLDDMTGERIGFAMEMLLESGALDVYCQPIMMKKSRPAVMLVCMCKPENRDEMAGLIFKHTTTIGVREQRFNRLVMKRHSERVETEYGSVRVKVSEGFGIKRRKAEYEDVAEIARENGISVAEVESKLKL